MAFPLTNEVKEDFKERITWWNQYILVNKNYIGLKLPKKHWITFMLYWMIFDAYLLEIFPVNDAKKRLNKFISEKSDLKEYIKNKKFSASALKELSPVEDMRPNPINPTRLDDENNLGQIFRFLYQIRCNLFHGSKDMKNARENELINEGYKYLEQSIGGWMDGR